MIAASRSPNKKLQPLITEEAHARLRFERAQTELSFGQIITKLAATLTSRTVFVPVSESELTRQIQCDVPSETRKKILLVKVALDVKIGHVVTHLAMQLPAPPSTVNDQG